MRDCGLSSNLGRGVCSLADGHGGPHYTEGAWWEIRTDPPDWSPPSFTVAIEYRSANGELHGNAVVNPDGPTHLDMTNHGGPDLTFTVHRLPRLRGTAPDVTPNQTKEITNHE